MNKGKSSNINGAEYLMPAQFARLLQVSRRHVDNLIRRGELPCIRLGRSVRIPRRAIDQLLKGAVK